MLQDPAPVVVAAMVLKTKNEQKCRLLARFLLTSFLYPFHIKPIMQSQRRFENNAV